MEATGISSLPITGAGSTALMAAISGHIIIALVLASLCAFSTGLLMLQRSGKDENEVDF